MTGTQIDGKIVSQQVEPYTVLDQRTGKNVSVSTRNVFIPANAQPAAAHAAPVEAAEVVEA